MAGGGGFEDTPATGVLGLSLGVLVFEPLSFWPPPPVKKDCFAPEVMLVEAELDGAIAA